MIDPNLKLTIFHDDDSSFTEYTNELVDYLSNPVTLTMTTADYLYFGYKKPFNAVYFEMKTSNINAADMTVEYYDGTAWTAAEYHDETDGFTRSGLVTWTKDSMENTTVNGTDKYYVRMSMSVDTSATEMHGANIVFSDDREMKQEFFEITESDFLPTGFDSHIPKHVAARNEIMQELRNRGNQKRSSDASSVEIDINPWDLHDVFQVRQAATYLALSKIFFNLSDNVEDNWFRKFEEYRDKYKDALSLYNLDVDTDDDGLHENDEKNNKYRTVRLNR